MNPANIAFDTTRLLVRKFGAPNVHSDKQHWPHQILHKDTEPIIHFHFDGEVRTSAPEAISSVLLTKIKKTRETYTVKTVQNAFSTVFANPSESQRRATRNVSQPS